ncbi:MAG: hypothetical protein DRJ62_06625 [Thermoprotei archaeon]|nr:MAG: hypothetical protein DRJ62_06625 [Thermoprotei archaeon]
MVKEIEAREVKKLNSHKPSGRVDEPPAKRVLAIEDIIQSGIVELTPSEAEELSIEAQKRRGIYG